MHYQSNYSNVSRSVLDKKIRNDKARKILTVIRDFQNQKRRKLKNMICLDIGGSAGFLAKALSPWVRKIYVIDIDNNALAFGKKLNPSPKIRYKLGDAMKLTFTDKTFDIVICNQVYEHVPDCQLLFKEIYRVMKDDGVCYLGAGNRFTFWEPHHHLPFLSCLPKKTANVYLRLAKGEKYYYENLLSYYGLKRSLKPFKITDYTIKIIKQPNKYKATDLIKAHSLVTKLPETILRLIEPIIPTYIFILSKKPQ